MLRVATPTIKMTTSSMGMPVIYMVIALLIQSSSLWAPTMVLTGLAKCRSAPIMTKILIGDMKMPTTLHTAQGMITYIHKITPTASNLVCVGNLDSDHPKATTIATANLKCKATRTTFRFHRCRSCR